MTQRSSHTQTEIVDRTRTWVRENYLYMRPDWKLGDDDPLLGSGVIDSIGVVELVEFLQSAFDFKISDEEIVEQNLGSLSAIGRFVHAKCHGTTAEKAGAGVLLRPRA